MTTEASSPAARRSPRYGSGTVVVLECAALSPSGHWCTLAVTHTADHQTIVPAGPDDPREVLATWTNTTDPAVVNAIERHATQMVYDKGYVNGEKLLDLLTAEGYTVVPTGPGPVTVVPLDVVTTDPEETP